MDASLRGRSSETYRSIAPLMISPKTTGKQRGLRGHDSFPLHDRKVPIHRDRRETVHTPARARPVDLQPIHLSGLAQPQDLARIVARHKASPCVLKTPVHLAVDAPLNDRPNRSRVSRG